VVEDGICCHSPIQPYIVIVRNRTVRNPRYGIHLGFWSHYSIVAGNVSESNGGQRPEHFNLTQWRPRGPNQDTKGLITFGNSWEGVRSGTGGK